jgi:uncharacterized protein (DUF697 family)
LDKKKIFDYAAKGLKDRIMGNNNSNNERGKHAETIIRNHVIWSLGAGFIPVVAADVLAVSALQLDMIRQLCRVYDVNFSETQGKAIVTSLTSSTIARLSATSVTKLIPVVGSFIGGVTNSIFAGASTYALGEVFKKHFESGGTILDFDPERLKKMYREKFEKGKRVARQLRKQEMEKDKARQKEGAFSHSSKSETAAEQPEKEESSVDGKTAIDRLKELGRLRDEGIISEEEFQEMKKKVIEAFK